MLVNPHQRTISTSSLAVRYLREINVLLQKQNSSAAHTPSHSQDHSIGSTLKRNRTTSPQQLSIDSMLYETKRVSLRLCYVFRRSSSAADLLVFSSLNPPENASPLLTDGTNGSVLDIVLPSTQTCYSVRFVDDMYARKWFYIIHSKISRYLLDILPEIEEHFYVTRNAKGIKAVGWLAERVKSDDRSVSLWQPVFLVVTESDVCFFSSTPLSRQVCREPDSAYPILSTR